VPENPSVIDAPADRRAALGLPPPVDSSALALALARARLGAVADALGTSPTRLAVGVVGFVVLAAGLAWALLAPVAGGNGIDDADLPRADPPTTEAPASTGSVTAHALVHVTGAVAAPGVYRAPPDARVADLLDAAGGPAPDADLDQLNLAAPVADGERVYVPRRGEAPPPLAHGPPGSGSAGLGSPGSGGGPGGGPSGPPLNLNTATAEQLDGLPGVGPATARAIVDWRRRNGRFRRVDDLLEVRGIGPAKLDALREQVRV
jgi:competence protein ComEA